MSSGLEISASEAFKLLSAEPSDAFILDVRSPGEFASARFQATENIPILSDEHRHQVGLTYKQKGSEAAQELGHELVNGSYRDQMIEAWCQGLEKKSNQNSPPSLVYCWRGGLRSQIAQQWILESGKDVLRVAGGYKGLREQAMVELKKTRDFVVLGGTTGSGKTALLKQIPNHVDLEGLANHRGSVFGLRLREKQPTQTNFENHMAQALCAQTGPILVEDESRLIGHRHLCNEIYDQMIVAPMVLLIVDRRIRAQHIFDEYLLEPQQQGLTLEEIHSHFKNCIGKIRPKLGGLQADQCLKLMAHAFTDNAKDAHLDWIELLLETYYDKLYSYSLSKKSRQTLHQGDRQSCLEFLKLHFERQQ